MPQSLVWAGEWTVVPPHPRPCLSQLEREREGGGTPEARGHLGVTVCPSGNISGVSLPCLALTGIGP